MIPRQKGEPQGWNLPMRRIVEELGGAVSWGVEEYKIVFPGGRVVKATERGDGLRYVSRQDLKWIRMALMRSHFQHRPLASKVKTCKVGFDVNREELFFDHNGEILMTKEMTEANEEVEAWRKWESLEYDPDEVWINKMACDKYLKDCVPCSIVKRREKNTLERSHEGHEADTMC